MNQQLAALVPIPVSPRRILGTPNLSSAHSWHRPRQRNAMHAGVVERDYVAHTFTAWPGLLMYGGLPYNVPNERITSMSTAAKLERLEARIRPEDKRSLERAAEISGRKLTDFVVSAACEAARETIQRYEGMALDRKSVV